jgi:C-terminal processing protease CtpA/Prc
LGRLAASALSAVPLLIPVSRVISAQERHGVTLRSVPRIGAPQWMFLDVFEDGPAARAGVKPGHLLVAVDGTAAAPPTFPAFRFGQKHQVTIELPDRKEATSIVLRVPPKRAKGRRPPLLRTKEPQLSHAAERRNIEHSVLFRGLWNPLLKTSRRRGRVTQSTRL